MSEPELQYSSLSGPLERDGFAFEIQIYKTVGEPEWLLEIVDERGTSHIFDERFDDDAAARGCAVEAIEAGELNPLAEEQEALLDAYGMLAHPDVAPGLSESPTYILGVFTALHTVPSVPQVAEVFGELFSSDPRFLEPALESLSELHTCVGECLETDQFWLAEVASHEDAKQWALGYLSVVQRDPVWMQETETDTEASELLGPVLEAARSEGGSEGGEAEELEPLCEMLEAVAADAYDHWRDLRRTLAAEQGAATFRRETPKVGRNEPCPCGSGKKYKKCCLRA